MQKKQTSPVFRLLIFVAIAAIIYLLVSPTDDAKKTTATKSPAPKKAEDSLYTKEDYDAKFEALNTVTKNAFMPVVVRTGGVDASTPNALPTSLTGGEGGWMYTGTAEVDGSIQAVVENPGTGEGDFLTVGQTWKNAKVVAVTDSTLTLEGPDGQQVTVKMLDKLSNGSMMAGSFAPVTPGSNLRGQIGRLGIQPTGTAPGTQAVEEGNNAN